MPVPPAPSASLAPPTLAAELRVSLMRAVRRLRAEKSDSEITDGQYCVLATLDRLGPRTPRQLADQERVQPPSMTRTVNALAEAGLVVRSQDPDDGRQVIVTLTDEGEALKGDAFGILTEIGKATGCSMAEAAALRSALHDLNTHLGNNQASGD